jgi:BA14K-like protein
MTGLNPLRAAAILSMMIATPVFAQAAIQEPGAYAFYHPDGDVLEAGVSRRREPAAAFPSVPLGDSGAYAAMDDSASASSCAQRYRSYDPESGTFLGYGGARRPCQ